MLPQSIGRFGSGGITYLAVAVNANADAVLIMSLFSEPITKLYLNWLFYCCRFFIFVNVVLTP